MLRSMYAAVSGVKAHQTYLDVTGNNIANVNTVGFKRDVIHFRDMIYQTIKNPSQPNPGIPIGGVNPAQVGMGVGVGSIETVHTQGSLQSTGIPTDMAIQGSGFFVVRSGNQQLYTRAGNFALDRDGNLVMQGNGYLVQGYAYKDMIDPTTGNLVRQRDPNLTNINIPIGAKIPAKATTIAAFRCNLCSTAKPDIPDLTSIPGGEAKVPRPHDYISWGGKSVNYVGDDAAMTAHSTAKNGETFFNTTDGMIYTARTVSVPGWLTGGTVNNGDALPSGSPGDRFYLDTAITGPPSYAAGLYIWDASVPDWVADASMTASNTEPTAPDPGDRWLDTSGSPYTVYTYSNSATTQVFWENAKPKDEQTYYVGVNPLAPSAGQFANIYSDGSTNGAAVAGRMTVDFAQDGSSWPAPVPPTTGVPPSGLPIPAGLSGGEQKYKAGATLLDTSTGRIYKVNSTATGWVFDGEMPKDFACAVRNTTTTTNIYIWDTDTTNPQLMTAPGNQILDMSNGNKNVFEFVNGAWKSINNTQDTTGTTPMTLSPSGASTTTQAIIEAFGEDIIKGHDYEDKFTVYDSKGNPYTMVVVFRKAFDRPADPIANPPVGAESEWDWYAYYTDSSGSVQPQYGQGAGTLVFGDDGLLKRTYTYQPQPPVPDPNATAAPTAPQYAAWNVIEKIVDPNDTRSLADASKPTALVVADFNVAGSQGSVDYSVNPATYGSNMILLDFLGSEYSATLGLSKDRIDGVTNFGSQSTTKMYAQDGYAMGVLNDWTIGGDGTFFGSYSNGRVLPIAQLAIAMFANPQGLSQIGETCFAETINSGIAQIGEPMTNGAGSIIGNTIEMSNVDLSEEFVNLIRAQRGFQANTRVVHTSDQVLEELINMKR